ncbi:hypothetical protein BCR32DRAFT_276994 [Anaeromyces robustus]|uniref:Uncharacterized protein n=1 Tax=Anaeromyces robustus TaxID=1754192 RepID=A0A1Y1XGU4_9FUNG|nr:hypothetical protein BCR32DRAFT_276994 [Anaeromyces robustus]|eukprot:ORX84604.1 hypothetical protein BCR32DRAFT_276994 [Anaeromyces robustus]
MVEKLKFKEIDSIWIETSFLTLWGWLNVICMVNSDNECNHSLIKSYVNLAFVTNCRSQVKAVLDNFFPGKNDNKCCIVPNNNNVQICNNKVKDELCPGDNTDKCCIPSVLKGLCLEGDDNRYFVQNGPNSNSVILGNNNIKCTLKLTLLCHLH